MIYTISQKMSNTGSIKDIASDLFDRDIDFHSGCQFAVVLAAYYGGKGYTVHRSARAACREALKLGNQGYCYEIIDQLGRKYDINWNYVVNSLHSAQYMGPRQEVKLPLIQRDGD
jgi:hypothetical protein